MGWEAGGGKGALRTKDRPTISTTGWDDETPGEGQGQAWGRGVQIQGSIFLASCFCQQLERKDVLEAISETNHGGWTPP